MNQRTVSAFLDELTKLGRPTAFSEEQYKHLFGPKLVRKSKAFSTKKDGDSESSSLLVNEYKHPISTDERVLEGKETPGGP